MAIEVCLATICDRAGIIATDRMRYRVTPGDRYFVVKGRLWRCSTCTITIDRPSSRI